MKYLCSFENCKELPEVYCKCQGLPKLMCCQHILHHYKFDKSDTHKLITAFKQIKNDEYDSIAKEILKTVENNKKAKKIIIEQTEKLIKISGQFVDYLNKINKFLQYNLSQIIKNNRIMIPSSFSKDDVTKLYKKDVIIYDDLRTIKSEAIKYFKMIDMRASLEESFFRIFDNVSMVSEYSSNNGESPEKYNENELYIYDSSQYGILIFNPENESFETLNFDSSTQMSGYKNVMMCKIDEINLFAGFSVPKGYNSYGHSYEVKTYIINMSNMQIELLDSGFINIGCSYQLYYKKIYIFGGEGKFNNFSDSKYFDLIDYH